MPKVRNATILVCLLIACGGSQPQRTAQTDAAPTSGTAAHTKGTAQVDTAPPLEPNASADNQADAPEGLPWNLEDQLPAETRRPVAIPEDTSLSMWVDMATVRASSLKPTVEKLIAALPTTPTLFTDGGISTVDTTDTLFIANESGHTMAFYVLATARGGSAAFEKHATKAGSAHGTPLTWAKSSGSSREKNTASR